MSTVENNYTLTTEDVGEAYANGVWNDGVGRAGPEVDTEFQRWLVAHDSAIRAAALEEAAVIALAESDDLRYGPTCRSVASSIRAAKEGKS